MSDPATRIVHALSAADSALRDEVVALAVDHFLGQRVSDLFDFDAAKEIVVRALAADNLARILATHARPGFDRYTLQVDASTATLGELVPEVARDRIRRLLQEGPAPRARWAQNVVEPALLRKLFAPVWVNLFSSFAKRLPIPGLSALGGVEGVAAGLGAGLAGRLTRSVQERAEKIVDRGRTAMGGLGAEVEKRVQAAARDFSEGASGLFREALAERLASPEGRRIVSEISEQLLDRLLATRLSALHEDPKRANVAEILQASAEIVGHSVGERFVVEAIDREVAAFVTLEGDRSLREVLEENGVLASVRTVAIAQLGKTARGLFGTPAFADWVARLLDA